MARPSGICVEPGCHELKPCPTHRKAWAPGQKAKTGRSGWDSQRRNARVLRRHRTICHVCGRPGGDQVDHVLALALGGADTDDNLRPIHPRPCHLEKTANDRQLIAAARRTPRDDG